MDVSTTMTATQLTLIWILLGGLCAWALFFAFLSLRPEVKRSETEKSVTMSHVLPSTPAPTKFHLLATMPATTSAQVNTGQLPHERDETRSVPMHL